MKKHFLQFILIVLMCIVPNESLFAEGLFSEDTVVSTVRIYVCGDDTADTPVEDCDGEDLDDETCQTFGFDTGDLSCNVDCTFDVGDCRARVNGGGGGGGGAALPVEKPLATPQVSFFGKSHPGGTVFLLKDGQVVTSVTADSQGLFEIDRTDFSVGDYIFTLYGVDALGGKSTLTTVPVHVSFGTITRVKNIFLSPTLVLNPEIVEKGKDIVITGYTTPKTSVFLQRLSQAGDLEDSFQTKTNENGLFFYSFLTSPLVEGKYSIKARSVKGLDQSALSRSVAFQVYTGQIPVEPANTEAVKSSDVNKDGRISLVDFSIVAFWYQKPAPAPSADVNHDGKVDLVDFSILAYYWTG